MINLYFEGLFIYKHQYISPYRWNHLKACIKYSMSKLYRKAIRINIILILETESFQPSQLISAMATQRTFLLHATIIMIIYKSRKKDSTITRATLMMCSTSNSKKSPSQITWAIAYYLSVYLFFYMLYNRSLVSSCFGK